MPLTNDLSHDNLEPREVNDLNHWNAVEYFFKCLLIAIGVVFLLAFMIVVMWASLSAISFFSTYRG
jgi:hypothetical protein